jgi:plasmid stabilization system protein ParE
VKIFITKRAKANFDYILDYLKENWNEKVSKAFIQKTVDTFDLLEAFPELGQIDVAEKQIRGFQMLKQIRLMYRIKNDRIIILSFFDVRQNPARKPK